MTDLETDVEYCLGAVTNIESELEQYFGKDDKNVLKRLDALEEYAAKLEDVLRELLDEPEYFWARQYALQALDRKLERKE